MLLLALPALANPLLTADCAPEHRADEALDAMVSRADAAIAALDLDGLPAAARAVEEALRCRARPVQVGQAAHVHRVLGVVAFVAGDEEASALWFGASRALDPTAPLGHTIGGPLESAWARALPVHPPERARLPAPRDGLLRVDGQRLDSRPAHLPYVLQVERDGQITHAAVQRAGTRPSYPVRGPDPDRPARRTRGWTLTAGASALLAAGALSGAALTRARYRDLDTPPDRAEALIPVNRALGVSGFGLAAVALGAGGLALATEW